jgi:condensin complex subunit 1
VLFFPIVVAFACLRLNFRSKKTDDEMDVDGEEDESREDDEEHDTEEDEPSMSIDGDDNHSAKKPKKKGSKLGPRKSQLDVAALSNEQEALAALQTDEILHLRLRKKYYVEALNFIRQIEGAMETMCNLLGSTNKPEVLEAMEFFRVAHEYKFLSAMVCDLSHKRRPTKNSCLADGDQKDAASHLDQREHHLNGRR